MFAGTQKDARDVAGEGAVFAGSKKCTRDGFECCHPECSEGSPPSQPKDNVTNLVIASRILPDMAISFAQCVMLSGAKHLLNDNTLCRLSLVDCEEIPGHPKKGGG